MSRTVINFWVDCTLLTLFVLLIWVSTVIRFVFPHGPSSAEWRIGSWGLYQWINLQFIILGMFVFTVVLHVMLHWTWVCGVISSRFLRRKDGRRVVMDDGTRTLYGVGLLIVLLHVLAVGVAGAALMMEGPGP